MKRENPPRFAAGLSNFLSDLKKLKYFGTYVHDIDFLPLPLFCDHSSTDILPECASI